MKEHRRWSWLLPILAAGCASAPVPDGTPQRPDILLVSVDSLRHDHLGCYGYARKTSPAIDRLAEEGARFDQAVATTSWTLPSHAAIFTGLYDSAHGLVDNGLRLGENQITLAEALRDAGYRTAGFYGGPYLHPTFGLGQGFDHYQSCMTALPADAGDDEVRAESRADVGVTHREVTGPRTVEEVARWLRTVDDAPIFLFVHLWDVHYDYLPPPEYVEMFDADYRGDLDARDLMLNPSIHSEMAARDLEHLVALYDAEIRFTDDTIAGILEALGERGRLDETLVVVTSDHGEEFFEHGFKGHARTLFDEVVRVPLVIRWPGRVTPGRVIANQTRTIDLMPTLLGAAGVEPPAHVQGRDLAPLLAGESLSPEPALTELLLDGRQMRALRTPAFKVFDQGPDRPQAVFDLAADPAETTPLPVEGEVWVRAAGRLAVEIEVAGEIRRSIAAGADEIVLDDETRRRLESLGYLGGDSGERTGPGN
jgi:arylsulfatase A-like enzyme